MNCLVSVIIPVYNVENVLRESVDSVLHQTYRNLEVILVDDGSPDNCPDICDEYAVKDHRVKVIHKENGGLADARNVAIAECNGNYIAFVDSDDIISDDCIERLTETAEIYAADMVLSPYQKFHEKDELFADSFLDNPEIVVKNAFGALRELLYQNRLFHTGAPCKLFRKELFEGVLFPVGFFYEDLATTYKLMLKCKTIVGINKRMYGYRIRPDSIMRQSYSEKMMSCIPVSQKLFKDISAAIPELSIAAASRAFSVNRAIFLSLPKERKEERGLIWNEMKKYRNTILTDPDARKREKVMAAISFLGKDFFYLLSPMYRKQQMGIN